MEAAAAAEAAEAADAAAVSCSVNLDGESDDIFSFAPMCKRMFDIFGILLLLYFALRGLSQYEF